MQDKKSEDALKKLERILAEKKKPQKLAEVLVEADIKAAREKLKRELERVQKLEQLKKERQGTLDTLTDYQVDVYDLTIKEVIDGVIELIDLAETEEELDRIWKRIMNFNAWFSRILNDELNRKAEERRKKGKFFTARKRGGWTSFFNE